VSILLALRAANQASADAEQFEVHEAADALSRAISVSRTERFLPTGSDPVARQAQVTYNHEGTRLATLGKSNVVEIWDVDTGQPLRSLKGNDEAFRKPLKVEQLNQTLKILGHKTPKLETSELPIALNRW
jgi:WD40 repeat protein